MPKANVTFEKLGKVNDLVTTEWRLACQMVLRDQDVLIEYPSK